MDNKPNTEREERFKKRDEQLLGFYSTKPDSMSDTEEDSLLPILNSLTDDESRYKEVGLIAEGGEKRITRAYDHRLKRQVAMARAVNAKTQQDQEQFLREAQLEANLAHPYIVPVYNMGIDPEGIPFFTMELIPGDNLHQIIKKLREGDEKYKSNYPLDILLNLFLKICDAMAYAHSRNVLHLDIKPDNIRVGGFGEISICDWGLARIVFEDEPARTETSGKLDGDVLNDITLSGIIKGTPGFMAPEQANADETKTFQTDLYALGALLYMLLTYELPVQGNSGNEILQNTREGKIIAPHTRKKGRIIPHSLAAVAMKALSLKPEDRYDSVIQLQQEIRRYLAGFPTTAERAGAMTMLSLLVRRHNRIASLALFFSVVMAVLISANMVVINKKKAEAVVARERAEENFRLYREQQKEAMKLGTELSDSTAYALQSSDYSKAREMIRALEIGLDKSTDPEERKKLFLKKGTLHFVVQEFNEAAQCFEEGHPSKPIDLDSWKLSKKYAEFKPNDRRMLPLHYAVELVEEAMSQNSAIYYFYFHYMVRKPSPSPEAYLPLARAMLDKVNRVKPTAYTHPLKIEKRKEGYHLDLTGSPYQIFSLSGIGLLRINLLEPLELYSMDISNLPLLTLAEFKGLHVNELTMTGVKVSRTRILLKQIDEMGVKKLTLDIDAYPPDIIEELRETHEVIDAKEGATRSP